MIITRFDPRHGYCSLIVESAEDLWTLRRVIERGDVVVTRSTRVVKREEEYSRPDKGERVKVTVALAVEEVALDSSIERIRVKGYITEASDETVSKAGSHAVTISPGHPLTIRKEKWTALDEKLIRSSSESSTRFVIVAVDRREAGIGVVSGSHLAVISTVESGLGGKMSEEQSSKPYMTKVADIVASSWKAGDEVIVAGPGNFKSAMANQLRERLRSAPVRIVEGLDTTGADGIRSLLKEPAFQEVAKGSLLVKMESLVTEVVKRVSVGDPKVAYSLPRVREAASAGAIEACGVSDDVFSAGVDEEQLVRVLDIIEQKGGSVYLADSSLEFGKQISAFGGIVALLRFALRA